MAAMPAAAALQLELAFTAVPPRPHAAPPERPRETPRAAARAPVPAASRADRAERAATFLGRLRAAGLRLRIEHCRLTRNRTVMVSWRGGELRVHEAFVEASADVVGAIVDFIEGRGAVRARARRIIVSYPVPDDGAPRRRERPHPDDAPLVARLTTLHQQLNLERFEGRLGGVALRVSRRMRRRLGHYAPRAAGSVGEIAVSRRHIRRHGWRAAAETLLHEMVHQWQDETGRPLGHGREFRRKAVAVGLDAHPERRRPTVVPLP